MADENSKNAKSKPKSNSKMVNGINVNELHFDHDGDKMLAESSNENRIRPTNVLIVTDVAKDVFDKETLKAEFESFFRQFDAGVIFHYLSGLRRVRVGFMSVESAETAYAQLKNASARTGLSCHYLQPLTVTKPPCETLQPPVPDRHYLLSPPSSPPVGWEPAAEREPIINYDLLAALANIVPGQAHELQPASVGRPGIVVHVCEDPDGYIGAKTRIPQTQCPERKT